MVPALLRDGWRSDIGEVGRDVECESWSGPRVAVALRFRFPE